MRSCSRMGLQATLYRASTCSSSLPFLLRHAHLRPAGGTSVSTPRITTIPRSSIQATFSPDSSRSNSSSRATSPPAVRCTTMPRDVEAGADVKKGSGMESSGWKIKMLYDGECPLCMREVNMLRDRNESYGAIKFVDICADDYSAQENSDIDYKTAMGRIHAIRHDGEVLTNIAAFRALYEEIGLGWVYAITYHQPWASILDSVYEFWAKYRLPITGRPPLADLLEKMRQRKLEGGKSSADEKRCRLD